MNIETKANVGDNIYFAKQIKRIQCPICDGMGKINLSESISCKSDASFSEMIEQVSQQIVNAAKGNLHTYTCPECKGKGTVRATGQPRYEVATAMITAIEVTYVKDVPFVKYRAMNGDSINFTLSEDKIYMNIKDAEDRCAFLNLERRLVPLDQIEIPRSFAATIPCNVKLMKRLNEWRNHKKFETEIYVNPSLLLFDGYTSYLIYRMLGITEVPVVIWPDNMR